MRARSLLRSSGLVDDPPIVWLFWIAYMAVVVGAIWVIEAYGGRTFWPVLVGGFAASLGAFLLALTVDHDRERREHEDIERRRQADWQRERDYAQEQLVTEARRRLEPIREELRRNAVSLDMLKEAWGAQAPLPDRILLPELLDFAWAANGSRLSQILADVDLVSKLATTYGRIEELRWRLRQRTSHMSSDLSFAQTLAVMTRLLIHELGDEVADLRERLDRQAEKPDVQELDVATVGLPFIPSRTQVFSAELRG